MISEDNHLIYHGHIYGEKFLYRSWIDKEGINAIFIFMELDTYASIDYNDGKGGYNINQCVPEYYMDIYE